MGIQAHIKIKDLEEAGVKIERFCDVMDDEDDPYTFYYVKAVFPTGLEFVFNSMSEDDTHVWTDFNSWGRNRAILQPSLYQLKIKFIEA